MNKMCLSWLLVCVQVFIQGNAEECGYVLKTILEQRRLCPLISPFFTPNSAPNQLVFLYQDVVTSLNLDSADVIFMLLTKVSLDTQMWTEIWRPVTVYTPLPLSPSSLICPSGWMKPIQCLRREPVCWSWSTALSASAAETLSLNFSHLFTSSPNTGPGFYATISPITTVTACVCLWPVSFHFFNIPHSIAHRTSHNKG